MSDDSEADSRSRRSREGPRGDASKPPRWAPAAAGGPAVCGRSIVRMMPPNVSESGRLSPGEIDPGPLKSTANGSGDRLSRQEAALSACLKRGDVAAATRAAV